MELLKLVLELLDLVHSGQPTIPKVSQKLTKQTGIDHEGKLTLVLGKHS
jgi:hypothetical protein